MVFKTYCVFGLKGSGKSLYFVKLMRFYHRRGFTIYSDFPVSFDWVIPISLSDLEIYKPVYKSCVFLDEVGISLDNRQFKSFKPGLRDFFKYSRKFGCNVFINSQSFDFDKKVRDLVDVFIYVKRFLPGFSLVRTIRRFLVLVPSTGDCDARCAMDLKFTLSFKFLFRPFYYRFYDTNFVLCKRDFINEKAVPP